MLYQVFSDVKKSKYPVNEGDSPIIHTLIGSIFNLRYTQRVSNPVSEVDGQIIHTSILPIDNPRYAFVGRCIFIMIRYIFIKTSAFCFEISFAIYLEGLRVCSNNNLTIYFSKVFFVSSRILTLFGLFWNWRAGFFFYFVPVYGGAFNFHRLLKISEI